MNEDAELLMNGLLVSPRLLAGCFHSVRSESITRRVSLKGLMGDEVRRSEMVCEERMWIPFSDDL